MSYGSDAVVRPDETRKAELDAAAPPHAMLAAFVFVLAAALHVAAIGGGLTRLPWLDPPGVCPARMPWRWDLLCFQHVLGVIVVVGTAMLAAMPAAMIVVLLVLCLFMLLTVKIFRSEE